MAQPSGLRTVIARVVGAHRRRLALVAAMSTLSGLLEAALLILVVALALGIARGEQAAAMDVGPVAIELSHGEAFVACVVLIACAFVLSRTAVRSAAKVSGEVLHDTRSQLLRAHAQADWPTVAADPAGSLVSLAATHAGRAANMALLVATAASAAFSLAALLVVAFVLQPVAAFVLVLVGVGTAWLLRPFVARSRSVADEASRRAVDYVGEVDEFVELAREARVFDVAERIADSIDRTSLDLADLHARSKYHDRFVGPLYRTVVLLGLIGALGMAAAGVSGAMDVVGATALLLLRGLQYGQQLQAVVQSVNDFVPYVLELEAAASRYEAGRMPRSGERLDRIDSLEIVDGQVDFEGTKALSGVDLEVSAGEAVAVLGPSGGGKSTLLDVLLRLRPLTSGAFRVNGADAETWDLADYRRLVVGVSQDTLLSRGSGHDAVRFFRNWITDQGAETALDAAAVLADLDAQGAGLDSDLGRGRRLSGGQRQRVGIARALAGEPEVLILDEPTSALDEATQTKVAETLDALRGRLTIILVTHRLDLAEICDRVVVVDSGRIVSDGPVADVLPTVRPQDLT